MNIPSLELGMSLGNHNMEFNPLSLNPNWLVDITVYSSLTFNGTPGDGVPVSQIDDLSGFGNHCIQASAGSQAPYKIGQINGYPALDFDGAADHYRAAKNFVSTDSDTWFFVYRSNSVTTDAILFSDYGNVNAKLISISVGSSSTIVTMFGRDAATNFVYALTTADNSDSLLVCTREPGEATVDNNDNIVVDADPSYLATTTDGGIVPGFGVAVSPDTDVPLAGTYFKGPLAFGMRVPGVLSAPDILAMKNYLKSKFGV